MSRVTVVLTGDHWYPRHNLTLDPMGWPSSGNGILRIRSRVTELPSTCYATVLWMFKDLTPSWNRYDSSCTVKSDMPSYTYSLDHIAMHGFGQWWTSSSLCILNFSHAKKTKIHCIDSTLSNNRYQRMVSVHRATLQRVAERWKHTQNHHTTIPMHCSLCI